MFTYDFMIRAFAASGIVALVAGLVGYFLVMRGQTFAGHALSHIGFAGATAAGFLGGSPLAVAFRLVLLSVLVGVVLAAIGFDPWNIIESIRLLFRRLWDLGWDAVNWLWRYFLLGAVVVIPVWLLSRIFTTPRRHY